MQPGAIPWTTSFGAFVAAVLILGAATCLIRWGFDQRVVRDFCSGMFQSLFKRKAKVNAQKLDNIFDLKFNVERDDDRMYEMS
jgi:hypothetical protein